MESGLLVSEKLFDKGRRTDLKKGEVLHRSDELCQSVGLVLSGEIRLARQRSTGRELLIRTFRPGELFAELIVFSGEKYPGWLTANEPSSVVEVGLSRLIEHLGDGRSLTAFCSGITRKMTHLSDTIEVQSFKTVKQKIAFSLLFGRAVESCSCDGENQYRINVSRLASSIDCSREAVSRALSEMEILGWISREGKILSICDLESLEDLL